jgi:putative PIN family toxin of toxin-antitoxin system
VRVVLDTNVLLAGVATHGLCEALLELCFRDHVVVLSEHILSEFSQHYRGKFNATHEQTETVLAVLRSHSHIVDPAALPPETFDDPDDIPVLATAQAGKAECLVTGDAALQAFGTFETVAILSPRAFYERLRSSM